MGSLISINALEQNVGVSSVVLTLSERINYLTNKSICIVELDYRNPSFSFIFEGESNRSKCIDNLVPFIKDTESVDSDFEEVLKINTIQFKNTNIDMLYGVKRDKELTDEQVKCFLYSLTQLYEVVIVDFGNKPIPIVIRDMSDINLLIVQPTYRYLNKLKQNRIDYIDRKTKLVVNNSTEGIKRFTYLIKDTIQNADVIETLPSSNTLVKTISRGFINIDKGRYSDAITGLALKVCKHLNLPLRKNNSLIKKMLGKYEVREKMIHLEGNQEYELAKQLLLNKICTEEDINFCIKNMKERKKEGGDLGA